MPQIVIASNNSGKIKEFQQIFSASGIEIIAQSALNVPEIDEPFTTFVENALHKARHCAKISGLPALADDSGLCVTALNGAPGIYSARFAGSPKSDTANNNKLLEVLAGVSERSAFFYCSLVYVRAPNDPQPIIAEGILQGTISQQPQGTNGHGYDPLFYVAEHEATLAQLPASLKNQISHRALALNDLRHKLQIANLL